MEETELAQIGEGLGDGVRVVEADVRTGRVHALVHVAARVRPAINKDGELGRDRALAEGGRDDRIGRGEDERVLAELGFMGGAVNEAGKNGGGQRDRLGRPAGAGRVEEDGNVGAAVVGKYGRGRGLADGSPRHADDGGLGERGRNGVQRDLGEGCSTLGESREQVAVEQRERSRLSAPASPPAP